MFKSLAAAYDKFLNAVRTSEINPLNQQYVPELVVEVTGGGDVAPYSEFYIDVDGFSRLGLQGTFAAGSPVVVISGTTEQGDPSGLTYTDKSTDWFGATTLTADFLKQIDVTGVSVVKVSFSSTSGTTNDYKITAYKQQG